MNININIDIDITTRHWHWYRGWCRVYLSSCAGLPYLPTYLGRLIAQPGETYCDLMTGIYACYSKQLTHVLLRYYSCMYL